MMRFSAFALAAGLALLTAQSQPLSIVLLVDVTSSVSEAMSPLVWDGQGSPQDVRPSGTKPPDSPRELFLRPIVRGFIQNLAPADRVRIGSISKTLRLSPTFSTDRSALNRQAEAALDVPAVERHGPSPLWDAVDAGVTALKSEPGTRVLVLVTDGLSTGNRRSLTAVIEHAIKSAVSVSVIREHWRNRSSNGWELRDSTSAPWKLMTRPLGDPIDAHIKRLASDTGGLFFVDGETQNPPAPASLFASLLEQLHRER